MPEEGCLFFWVYIKAWTRLSPYGFGMYAAYVFLDDLKTHKKDPLINGLYLNNLSTAVLETLCFITTWILAIYGSHLGGAIRSTPLSPNVEYVYAGLVRPLYGLTLTYVVYLALNPACPEISWYRPAKITRTILSWNIWLPFATLSYSCYLFHIIMLIWPF